MTQEITTLAETALRAGLNLAGAVLILIVGWIAAGWAQRMTLRGLTRHPKADRTIATVFSRTVRWAIVAITLVTVLGRFGVQTTSIVALLGAAGLAVGLALQGTLSNVAAGVMLLTLRPFRIGDAVDIAGMGGSVDDIGLFVTRLTTFDGVPAYLPNTEVWGKAIKNFSQAGRRRFDLSVGIGYRDDTAQALEVMRQLVTADPRVLPEPAPSFAVASLGDSRVNLLAQVWTAPGDMLAAQQELTRALKDRFDAAGISMPFPQRELHIVQPLPAAEAAVPAEAGRSPT